MKIFYLHIIFFIVLFPVVKTQTFIPINSFYDETGLIINTDNESIKPFISNISLQEKDSLITNNFYKKTPGSYNWFIKKLRYEHLLRVRENNFNLNISPLLILETGTEKEKEKPIYRNTRGIYLEGTIDKKIGFYSTFYENQSRFMDHIAKFADYYGVVPGQGFHKPYKNTGYDYAWSEGMIWFQLLKKLTLQFGHGKRFVGNGYRSLLYSDNSFGYPHLYLQYDHNKIRYAAWFTSFMDPGIPEPDIILNHHWQRKAGVFHYLSYLFFDNLELGLFEGNILNSRDSKGNYTFDIRHYNPFIYTNSICKETNNYIGSNFNLRFRSLNLYGQYIFNPQAISKNGFQCGTKYRFIYPYLLIVIQGEMNRASKGLYTYSDSVISYTHFNQTLAHPLGENFTEYILKTSLRFHSVELEYKFNYAVSLSDSTGSLPALNLFYPDNELIFLSEKSNRKIHEIKLSYIINPQYNMRFTLGAYLRNYNYSLSSTNTSYLYISFQTPIFNRYYDF